MSNDGDDLDFGLLVDRQLAILRGGKPDDSDSRLSELREVGAIVKSLVNSSPAIPPIENDPVATRLGLVARHQLPHSGSRQLFDQSIERLNLEPQAHHAERSPDESRTLPQLVAAVACLVAVVGLVAGGLFYFDEPDISVRATSSPSVEVPSTAIANPENEPTEPVTATPENYEVTEPPLEEANDFEARGTGTPFPADVSPPPEDEPPPVEQPAQLGGLSGVPDLDRPLGVAQGQGLVFFSTATADVTCQEGAAHPLFARGTDAEWLELAALPGPILFASVNEAGWLYVLSGCDWERPQVTGGRFVERQLSQLVDLGIHEGAHGWSGTEQVRFGDSVVSVQDGSLAAAVDQSYQPYGTTADASFRYVANPNEWNCGWVDDPPFPLLVESGADRRPVLSEDFNYFGGLRHLQFGPTNRVAWLNECESMGAAHPEVWVASVNPVSGVFEDPARLLPRGDSARIFEPHGPNEQYGPDSIVFDIDGSLHAWAAIEGELVEHVIN